MGWEGRHGRKLSRIPAALPNPCSPQVSFPWQCSAGSWHSFCPHQPPAKCVPRVSLLCPCGPAGITELQALDRPWCTTSMEEMWLGISGTIAPLCLGEPPAVVGRQPGLAHTGRLSLHCPKAAWLSLQPREAAGVPRATSHGCANSQDLLQLLDWSWQFGTERVPRPLPGLQHGFSRGITSGSKRCVNKKEQPHFIKRLKKWQLWAFCQAQRSLPALKSGKSHV